MQKYKIRTGEYVNVYGKGKDVYIIAAESNDLLTCDEVDKIEKKSYEYLDGKISRMELAEHCSFICEWGCNVVDTKGLEKVYFDISEIRNKIKTWKEKKIAVNQYQKNYLNDPEKLIDEVLEMLEKI